ncbi:uncharacterized protein V6R79_008684 [Siganus canaliculatus]
MSETAIALEPQLSVQPPPQPESERGLQPLGPAQDPSDITQQEIQLQAELQLSEPQAKPARTNHPRLLRLLLGFSLCAAVFGLIYYIHHQQNRSHNTETQCLSPHCQWASARLSVSANPFTQPCDYFLFTCGPYKLLPDNGGRKKGQGFSGPSQNQRGEVALTTQSSPRKLREEKILDRKTVLLQNLREILDSSDRPNSTAVKKARGFYHSCLDTKSIQSAGAEPFLTLIQKLGGWAVSGQWNQTDFNATLALLMRDYATFPFFSVLVGKDPNEMGHGSTRRYIQIDQPDLLIPTEWNEMTQKSQAKTETLRPFLASCQRYLALLGAPASSSMLHVGTFISLSSELAVAASPLHYRQSKGQLYQRMTIKQLQSQAPAIDWLTCLQAAFHPLPLTEDDHIFMHNLPYIQQMSRVIRKWLNKNEPRHSAALQTYMLINLLHTLMPALDSRFSETANNLSAALGNSKEVEPRWNQCVLETERGFDTVLRDLLSERQRHKEAEEVIQNIFSSFKSKLLELKWKDQKALKSVLKKVKSLIPRLWATKEIFGDAELDQLFSGVTVSSHSFFSSYVKVLSLWQKRRNKLFAEESEAPDILSVTPFVLGNELLFPMGMFVPPLFHPTYPRAMNYGIIGFLIAKDILHLILPNIFSQSATVRAVGECVWTRYLTVTEKAGQDNQVSSLSAAQQQEIWAQYSALQIALEAYHQSLKNNPSDTSIAGLSQTRLFFTSFSQVKCDSDPYSEFMPLEPSFLITVICAKSDLCPTNLQCPNNTRQQSLQTC